MPNEEKFTDWLGKFWVESLAKQGEKPIPEKEWLNDILIELTAKAN